ncbi:UNVERIFIED_CONTAM: hypothetical protein H355_007936 [Colinus virginianus]|nr:hypothetical protein H355_007936 [Colinus virginianus]
MNSPDPGPDVEALRRPVAALLIAVRTRRTFFCTRVLCCKPGLCGTRGKRWSDRMAPVNQPEDKKLEKAHEHQLEDAKSAGKRKPDHEGLENEPLAKKLFVRKTSKAQEKIGWYRGGTVMRNTRALFHQPKWQCSIVHYVYQNMLGGSIRAQLRQCLQLPFLRSLTSYRLFRTASPFDRRVTCLEWHPTHPSTVAVGSKGGDIILWDYEVLTKTCFIKGKGPGDSLGDIKFSPYEAVKLYVASGDGTLSLQDLEGRAVQVISRAPDCGHENHNVCCWYCSVDVSASCRAVVTGDNLGNVVLLSTSGEEATWHPRYDLIVVGRYPDPKFPGYTVNELRTVDIFDGNTGEMVCQLYDPNASGIISLNKFNPMGDTLASGMGFNILIWSREEMVMKKQEHLLKAMTEQGIGSRSLSRRGGQRQANPGTSKLKAKLLSWEVEEMRTKTKDSKSQGRK